LTEEQIADSCVALMEKKGVLGKHLVI